MGLLDYIRANTPRSTRQRVSPATVINQGLINPNQFNAPAANRLKDSVFGLLGVVPGVGDAASAAESADLFNRGENFAGGVAALGALPIIPALGGMFIGKGAKTWDALKAQQAEEMLSKGVDPRAVWKQTGTLRGVDNALRQEIPDNAAAFIDKGFSKLPDGTRSSKGSRLDKVLSHDEAFSAYPGAKKIDPAIMIGGDPALSSTGSWKESQGLLMARGHNDSETLGTTLHELQHAIQQREGWARGGSPESFAGAKDMVDALGKESDNMPHIVEFWRRRQTGLSAKDAAQGLPRDAAIEAMGFNNADEAFSRASQVQSELNKWAEAAIDPHQAYRRLAGEAEARLTQSRMNLTPEERLMYYPYDMGQYGLDVPLDQLIVRGLLK